MHTYRIYQKRHRACAIKAVMLFLVKQISAWYFCHLVLYTLGDRVYSSDIYGGQMEVRQESLQVSVVARINFLQHLEDVNCCLEPHRNLWWDKSDSKQQRIWRCSGCSWCRHHMVHIQAQHQRAKKTLFILFSMQLSTPWASALEYVWPPSWVSAAAVSTQEWQVHYEDKGRAKQLFLVPLSTGQEHISPHLFWRQQRNIVSLSLRRLYFTITEIFGLLKTAQWK